MTYPTIAQRLAPAAHQPSALERRLQREQAIQDAIRVMAGRFLLSVPDLSDAERQYLTDIRRTDPRYKHLNIVRLIELSNRSKSASDRVHFQELVRAHTYSEAPVPDVITASNRETESNGPCDVAIRDFEQHPTHETKERAVSATREQLDATRELLDAVEHTEVA